MNNSNSHANPSAKRTSLEIATGGGAQQQHQQHHYQQEQPRTSYDMEEDGNSSAGYDPRSSEEYEYDQHQHQQHQYHSAYQSQPQSHRNGVGTSDRSGAERGGYSVANTHDYLGYGKDQQPFDRDERGLWDDEERGEEMW